jgi:hypothetical protein
MRKRLKSLQNERKIYRATVQDFGEKSNRWGTRKTILLANVILIETEELITDHLWFNQGQWSSGLSIGDEFEFHAKAGSYKKGYVNHRLGIDERRYDYRLKRPTRVQVVQKKEPVVATD